MIATRKPMRVRTAELHPATPLQRQCWLHVGPTGVRYVAAWQERFVYIQRGHRPAFCTTKILPLLRGFRTFYSYLFATSNDFLKL